MSVSYHTEQRTRRLEEGGSARRVHSAPALGLAAIETVVGANAVMGGAIMIRSGFGMPVEWLARTPFDSWAWPGVLLIGTVAVPQLLAALAVLVVTRWSPRIGWLAGWLAGGGLVVWIVVQAAVLQHYFFLQPVIAGLGALEILLATLWWRREKALTTLQ